LRIYTGIFHHCSKNPYYIVFEFAGRFLVK